MAEVIGKDEATYAKERDGFLRDLRHFHETRGTPFKRCPTLGGKEIDLYLLYNLVTSEGGWMKVNLKNSWSDFLPHFKLPAHCVNGSVALKQIYLRFLDRWEKVHNLGDEADRASDDDDESRHKRWSSRALHSVPHVYNYSQHNVPDDKREYNHLDVNIYKPSDYDRLALSLISPLPNEQDFAINVCTLLSNDSRHTLKLDKHPRIINYLLAHAGIFNHSSLRQLFTHFYGDIRKKPIHTFWNDVLESDDFLELTNELKFYPLSKKEETNTKPSDTLIKDDSLKFASVLTSRTNGSTEKSSHEESITIPDSDAECEIVENNMTPSNNFQFKADQIDSEIFCLRRTLGTQDYIGQRVLQIATILRNLCFIEENLTILTKNSTFIRFLLLCACSQWNALRNLGLDMLGERSCAFIANNHGVIDTLVSLVTVEGKSYGPKACIGMKLVETIPTGGGQHQTTSQGQQSPQPIAAPQQMSPTSTTAAANAANVLNSMATSPAAPSVTPVKVISNTPSRNVALMPQRLLTTPTPVVHHPQQIQSLQQPSQNPCKTVTPLLSTPNKPAAPTVTTTTSNIAPPVVLPPALTPQQMIQQQHAHQQAIHENEQFALAWLRATYEPCMGDNKIDHQELYKHYLSSCSKIGRRGVISPLHFPRCVRSVFGGTVGPNPMKPANPTDPQYYEGIKAVSHPHLSQALLGGSTATASGTSTAQSSSMKVDSKTDSAPQMQGSSSSLIKSLLATKVNDACVSTVSMKSATTDCQNVAQVAARQQRLLAQQGPSSSENPPKNQSRLEALKMHRINGVRQLFTDNEIGDPSVSSTTQFVSTIKGKKEPPQPPPPPLAPLSNVKAKTPPVVNEDSDSIDTHSLSSTSGLGGVVGIVSSTEDNENSLTSFEGLLNGMPIVEETLNESSNSKDSVKNSGSEISIDKPLRLADLLEKKFDKNPTLLNGTLGKDLKSKPEKQDLIENHIDKVLLARDEAKLATDDMEVKEEEAKQGIKRHATEQIVEVEAKKPHLANANGASTVESLAPDSSSSNGEEGPTTVSTAAAKLFADIAADILEDEDEEQLMQEAQTPAATPIVDHSVLQQQIIVENNQQMLLSQSTRQIIVSQSPMPTSNQSVVISSGTQLKTQTGQTVIVQNAGVQQRQSVLIQPTNAGQLLLSQGLQGQVQLVPGTQPGQYVLQTNPSQGYVVAQPQTAVVHGQPQTVLVAQQGQNAGAKTIIILQQQPTNAATHHQKVVVTPQGQQVVVTQVPRPLVHSSTVSNNNLQQTKVLRPTPSPSPALSTTSTSSTISNGVKDKQEDLIPKVRIIRDLTTPFVCEWGDCMVDTKFKSPNEVYMHACASHCPQGDEEVICLWDRCDMLKRKRFSLMTHLHDKHCNIEAMKQSLVRRKKASQGITVEPPPSTPTNHPGYAPDAAIHAIQRHALEFVNPKELQIKSTKQGASTSIKVLPPPTDQDDNEGPVTKSIRLTASLILRNLVIYSSNCKRYLKSYESHLANIALSNVESSRTIAQILYDINDGSSHR
ncbi:hypothetical protein GWI33_016488 [Rhynchophorus ferrugineus]|uniref:AT-rich interactive domain-containing protein 2 n=1 Tax=Rhynchophorus ferrugineus TaxID=354439 RepID=A0A834I0R6_RHYFE|nr:hypothetical protein GWI33_016488 [Rhynchophorus ferrugineus]